MTDENNITGTCCWVYSLAYDTYRTDCDMTYVAGNKRPEKCHNCGNEVVTSTQELAAQISRRADSIRKPDTNVVPQNFGSGLDPVRLLIDTAKCAKEQNAKAAIVVVIDPNDDIRIGWSNTEGEISNVTLLGYLDIAKDEIMNRMKGAAE